jgi:3-hydroxybutyryl-CoA dehydrogenase
MAVEEIFVLGAGFMGAGIAQVSSLAGYRVTLCDTTEERLSQGLDSITDSLRRMVKSGRIDGEAAEAALRLETTTALQDARSADLVVEAVFEDLALKQEMFSSLDDICRPETILATNTSAISITSIASATERPALVVGVHFFGPVPIMKLCEMVKGLRTSEETLGAVEAWVRSLGKEPIIVRRDVAGFIANRVTIPGSLEAVRMVEDGFASPDEIDHAATFGVEKVPGPLQIMDAAGIDVSFAATMAIYEDTGDPRFYPPPIMRRMKAAGMLGRKTGRGFYDYTSDRSVSPEVAEYRTAVPDLPSLPLAEEAAGDRDAVIMRRVMVPMIMEAARLVASGVASPVDIDKAARLGFNFPLGPCELADSMGLDNVLQWADELLAVTGSGNFAAPALLHHMVESGRTGRESGRGFYEY